MELTGSIPKLAALAALVLFVVPALGAPATSVDAPLMEDADGSYPLAQDANASKPRVEEHEALRWLQVNHPEQYALLLEADPGLVESFRNGSRAAHVDPAALEKFDPFATMAGVPGGEHLFPALVGLPGVLQAEVEAQEGFGEYLAELLRRQSASDDGAERETLPPPTDDFRKLIPTCDRRGDGTTDAVVVDFQRPTMFSVWPFETQGGGSWGRTELQGLNASSGETEWILQNGMYLPMMPLSNAPSRVGTPNPDYNIWNNQIIGPPDVMKVVPDANGDGVCDFAAFGFEPEWPLGIDVCLQGLVCLLDLIGTLRVHDGVSGDIIWDMSIDSRWLAIPALNRLEVTDYPTGWDVFTSPSGPKIVWKTTNASVQAVAAVQSSDDTIFVAEFVVHETYQILDTQSGQERKKTVVEHPPSNDLIETWLTGVADLGGDEEFEIIYDQKRCFVCAPDARPGVSPSVGALRGELQPTNAENQHFWPPQEFYTPPHSGTGDGLPGNIEDDNRIYLWYDARTNGDVSGDGVADILATYATLQQPAGHRKPLIHTHIAPINGTNGELLWGPKTLEGGILSQGQDIKVQGWGYARALPGPDGIGTKLVIGSSDLILAANPHTRHDVMENFVTVLEGSDGRPSVNHRAAFGIASPMVHDLAIRHARDGLGIADWTGDGYPDLITPFIEAPVENATQRLLGQLKHKYLIIDSQAGQTVSTLQAWGGMGTPLPCIDDDTIMVVSGHGRRIDVSRLNIHTGETLWRQPFFNNPMPPSMTAGTQLTSLSGACAINQDGGATAGVNAGFYSLLRGDETMAPIGMVPTDGQPAWIDPEILGEAALEPSIDFMVIEPPEVSAKQGATWAGTSTVTGSAFGVGLALLYARRWGL